MSGLEVTFEQIVWLAIALARGAATFALLPLFSPQTVPPLVRNSVLVGFGVMVLVIQPPAPVLTATNLSWLALFCREIFIGLVIGFFFGSIVWSLELAGQFIDAKVGPAQAVFTDPFSGQQTSVFAALMSRLANFIFASCGGFLFVTGAVLKSYAVWPITAQGPSLRLGDSSLFTDSFQGLMVLALGFAAPVLVVLALVEASAGLLNRFSPQLNVFSVSLAVKSWVAGWMLLLISGVLVQTLATEIIGKLTPVLGVLARLRG